MPRAQGTGGNKRKKGKKFDMDERELIFKEEEQEYAQIIRLLGDSRMELNCFDGVKRIGIIRGKIKKRVWMGQGDIVLVSLRDFEDDKCDILHKYQVEEVMKLKKEGEVPDSIKLPAAENQDDDIDGEDEENDDALSGSDDNRKKNEDDIDLDDL